MARGIEKSLIFEGLPPSPTPLYYYNRLNPQQRVFVDSYVVTYDVGASAAVAGYKPGGKYAINSLVNRTEVRCAIREKMDLAAAAANLSAADFRRELKLIVEADLTEISGIIKVPCRNCWGINNQFQYTTAEMFYVEQAYDYGADGWPITCITSEYGRQLLRHAEAAYFAGTQQKALDRKGGTGYTKTGREINPNCPQCDGRGVPMPYVCDTRKLSEGGKKLFHGVKELAGGRFEVTTVNREHIRAILARDLQVGIERRELTIRLPKTPEELREAVKALSDDDLVQLANGYTLAPDEYKVEYEPEKPKPKKRERVYLD